MDTGSHTDAEHHREYAERLRLALEAAEVGIWDWDLASGDIVWNKEHARLFGVPDDEFDGTYEAFSRRVHPDDLPMVAAAIESAREGRTEYSCEHRVVWPDGTVRWIAGRGRFYYDRDGTPLRMTGTVRDVTERRRASEVRELERELAERTRIDQVVSASEARFRALAEGTPGMVWACDDAGRAIYLNPRWYEYTGFTQEQSLGDGWAAALHPDDAARTVSAWRASVESGRPYEAESRYRRRDGAYHWHLIRAVRAADLSPPLWIGTSLDIDEHRRAREALHEAESRYRDLFENSPLSVVLIDPETDAFLEFNKAAYQTLGYTAEEFAAMRLADTNPGLQADVLREHRAALESTPALQVEVRHLHKSGAMRDRIVSVRPTRRGDRTLLHCVAVDVTDKKRAGRELQQLNARLELLADVAGELLRSDRPQAVIDGLCQKVLAFLNCDVALNFLADPEGAHLALNVAVGVDPEVARGMGRLRFGEAVCGCVARDACRVLAFDLADSIDPQTAAIRAIGLTAYACHPLMAQGKVLGTLGFGSRTRGSFGEAELSLMKAVADQIAIAIQRLVSQQALQESEREARRAREVAEAASKTKDHLLAVVSHELRTPLNPILAIASYLQSRADVPADLRDEIATIRRNAEQEARLVDDLLNLTRLSRGKIVLHHEAVDAHGLVHAVLAQYRAAVEGKEIELSVALRAREHHVWADPGRLQQVLSNLLDNAVKFTPAGGRVAVRSAVTPGHRLRIEVIDSGVGIEPDMLERLFRPFEQGEKTVTRQYGGLGLGLVIAKGIAELHGGTLSASSEGRDRGATMVLELDLMQPVGEPTPVADGGHPASPAAGERRLKILLVEDHPDTLRIMSRLLSGMGYSVLQASTVKEATDLARSEAVDLLVSDIGLPDGTGHELLEELRKSQPIKAIALSGFGQEEDIRRSKAAGFAEHVVKPVNFEKLEAAIKRLVRQW